MRTFTEKACVMCGELYLPTGSCSKYCTTCRKIALREQQRIGNNKYRAKKGCLVGVGKGHGRHPRTSNVTAFFKIREKYRATKTCCEWCGKNLENAGRYEWCVHHVDHDRSNNTEDNLVYICKRCHQIHHDCHKALLGSATTISSVEADTKRTAPATQDEDIV